MQCTKCFKDKPIEMFSKTKVDGRMYSRKQCKECYGEYNRAKTKAYRAKNQEKTKLAGKQWKEQNPDKVKMYGRRYTWKVRGINPDIAEQLLAEWNGLCAICLKVPDRPCIDHCHTSLKVRAVLCSPCNQAIGLLKEDVKIILAAAEYVKQHKA
jgi:hypothetical protein